MKNKNGEFIVRTNQGDIVVARPDEGTKAIGDMGLIRTDLNERVKIVPGAQEGLRSERLVEIDGRLHLVSDEEILKDNRGNAYGLILQDKETGQEVFFSVDNEITQEIMRKAMAGRFFSKVKDPNESGIFQIGIAPFKNRPIVTQQDFDDAMSTPQHSFFVNTLQDVASELNINIQGEFAALGG